MGKRQKQSAAGKEGLAAFSLSIPSTAAAAEKKRGGGMVAQRLVWRERERKKASFLLFLFSGFA